MAIAVSEVPKFESLFDVPATHQLFAVRSRSRGGSVVAEFWEHDEYSPDGHLVARYESYEEVTSAGTRYGCWRKFDTSDRLVTVGGSLH
jgi:hypothetical protein